MKTIQSIPLSMLLLGAVASQTGCVDASGTIRILRNQAPAEGCVVPTAPDALFLSNGIISADDAQFGYLFTPLVESRAVSNNSTDRRVFLNSAVVRLRFADGFFDDATLDQLEESALSYFSQPVSGSIASDGGTAALSFEIISKELLTQMAGVLGEGETTRVIAEVEMRGTVDGNEISSPTFEYPVEVCVGCLRESVGTCIGYEGEAAASAGVCQGGQDGVSTCCTNSSGDLVCPAVAEDVPTE